MNQAPTSDNPSSTPSPRHVVITANPYSGSKVNRRHVEALAEALGERGLAPELMWEKDALAPLIAGEGFASKYRCVVAAGGDGTLSHVINHRPGIPVAVFPLGTENLFAREFGYNLGVGAMADAIRAGATYDIDLGRCGDKLFSIVASAGFDAEVVHRLAAWRAAEAYKLRRVSRAKYAPHILRAFASYPFPKITVNADGHEIEGTLVLVFNMPQYGAGLKYLPQSNPFNGMLNYVVFQKPGRINLARYSTALVMRRHLKLKDVYHGRAKSIRITADPPTHPVPLELDGDAHGTCPVDLHVEAASLRIIRMPDHVPPQSVPADA